MAQQGTALDQLLDQMVQQRLDALVAERLGNLPIDTVIAAAPADEPINDDTIYVGTVSKVAVHKLGLQMQESEQRYWNIAKAVRDKLNYDGISEGMKIRLTLNEKEQVVAWAPADAPKGGTSRSAARSANGTAATKTATSRSTGTTKGAAKAAPAPKPQTLDEWAAEMAAMWRTAKAGHTRTSKTDEHISCPFCSGVHYKYKEHLIGYECAANYYQNQTGAQVDIEDGESLIAFGQWLKEHRIAVFSYGTKGYRILDGAACAAPATMAQEAAAPANPKVISPSVRRVATTASPSNREAARSDRQVAEDPKKHRELIESKKVTHEAPEVQDAPKEASTQDTTFRAIIEGYPSKKIAMVKLAALDGSGSNWFEYDISLDITRHPVGAIVDATVQRVPDSKSRILVGYTVVSKPATTAGIENSGKQQPPAPKVKHVSNRQRNEARRDQKAKNLPKQTAPADEAADAMARLTDVSKYNMAMSTDDIDAKLATAGKKTRAKAAIAAEKARASKGVPSGIPGISVTPDPKSGTPTFVVDNPPKRKRAKKNGLIDAATAGEECPQCGRRFSMVGRSDMSLVCKLCDSE